MKLSKLQKWCDSPEKIKAYIRARNEVDAEMAALKQKLSDIGFVSYSSLWSPLGPCGIEITFTDGRTEKQKGSIYDYFNKLKAKENRLVIR